MDPKRKPLDDETAADPDKNAGLETYEQEVERASVESVAEHPGGLRTAAGARRRFPSEEAAQAGVARRSVLRPDHATLAAWISPRSRRRRAGSRQSHSRSGFSPYGSLASRASFC